MKVTLSVGTLEENVTVVGESATVVQTQSPAIATNITGVQTPSLPLTSRNALDSLTSLAGLQYVGRGAELDGERPAKERDQHHARRHERPGQLPQIVGRVFCASDAVDRLGRGSHRH